MDELRGLARRAYPDWDTAHQEKLVRDRFLNGVDRELRKEILLTLKNNEDLNELVQLARRIEHVNND